MGHWTRILKMGGYSALKITGPSTGLVQNRENFLLPDDAYPTLQNAYVWRERIKRKKGFQLLGRLQRNIGTTDGAGNLTVTINPQPIQPGLGSPSSVGIVSFTVGSNIFTDPGGMSPVTLLTSGPGTATLDRVTGVLTIAGSNPTTAVQYFPGLPVMGIRIRELQNSANDQTVFFDQNYAYTFNSGTTQFQEFIAGTTWNAANVNVGGTDFFWSTNYWIGASPPFPAMSADIGKKLFWVTNGSGGESGGGDPPRITGGSNWISFVGNWSQIDSTNTLFNWLCNLPHRGRMVVFNTYEGATASGAGNAQNFPNRIRWSTIGNPFIPFSAGPPATGSWRSDIRGQGGFLDIPTSEDIVSIGFVRDNLVIYCERSTWQLRYTGRTIAPFQIERVNSELGVESTFSAVQFDTSLVGIGDKGIVECDSYKSERIDIKIPDFVFTFNALNNGVERVQGIRDFPNRLAYWTVPIASQYDPAIPSGNQYYPNQRLVYNYENDSWALFNDSLTTLGNYQAQSSRTWLNTLIPWIECEFTWVDGPQEYPLIVGGNQQGFIEVLNQTTANDVSLFISNIVNTATTAQITCPNHNMNTGFVIGISGIPSASPFSSLNGGIYGITVTDANTFTLATYDSTSGQFDTPILGTPGGTYVGGGLINIRENFSIVSKKFNFLDEGQNIQIGFIDILMVTTGPTNPGAISLNIYLDYDDQNPSNILPNNIIDNGNEPVMADTFFNAIIPTSNQAPNTIVGTKFWQRVYCPTRANFLTLQYTFSNAQLAGIEQQLEVQIDAQILWIRRAGRMTNN